jgi:hypothetical protein
MLKFLRLCRACLSCTTEAWEGFKQTDMGCFAGESREETSLQYSLATTDEYFLSLGAILRRLQNLQEEISQDYPQGVS